LERRVVEKKCGGIERKRSIRKREALKQEKKEEKNEENFHR